MKDVYCMNFGILNSTLHIVINENDWLPSEDGSRFRYTKTHLHSKCGKQPKGLSEQTYANVQPINGELKWNKYVIENWTKCRLIVDSVWVLCKLYTHEDRLSPRENSFPVFIPHPKLFQVIKDWLIGCINHRN